MARVATPCSREWPGNALFVIDERVASAAWTPASGYRLAR
jgi:hypothetical protein